MLKGNAFQKSGKRGRNGNTFTQILLEVYKCITDISKTAYPLYRISSNVFTTVSGRACTKGRCRPSEQTARRSHTAHRPAHPLSPPRPCLHLESKQEMGKAVPGGKNAFRRRKTPKS
ncbi:unnamed protein product [Pipistrellus nathusii]|uniref:Uncharacterized protein n=1 Tax=Pipistrellus nathusii TaxID=59473 RepID=A0ABN9ZFB9_PIPNA